MAAPAPKSRYRFLTGSLDKPSIASKLLVSLVGSTDDDAANGGVRGTPQRSPSTRSVHHAAAIGSKGPALRIGVAEQPAIDYFAVEAQGALGRVPAGGAAPGTPLGARGGSGSGCSMRTYSAGSSVPSQRRHARQQEGQGQRPCVGSSNGSSSRVCAAGSPQHATGSAGSRRSTLGHAPAYCLASPGCVVQYLGGPHATQYG
jgi:hypothetical protein